MNNTLIRDLPKQSRVTALVMGVVLLALSSISLAARTGDVEYSFVIPATESTVIDFDGGAQANIDGDVGFGFGFGVYYSEQFVAKMEFNWNSSSYSGTRILDDGNRTSETISGAFNSFNWLVGGDYYLTRSKVAPFVSANIGYSYLDSNIPSGAPSSACWWDPWLGYICNTFVPTYTKDTWFYGAGLGVRFEINERTFFKIGYYEEVMDIDRATNDPSVGMFKIEFGGRM